MRLLILTQAVDKGDPALGFFHRWLVEFARSFESVIVIALRVGAYDLPANVKVMSLGKEKGAGRLDRIRTFYSLIRTWKGEYDAVFVHMNPEYAILGGIYWRLLGKKVLLWYLHKSVNLKLRLGTFFSHIVATASRESFRLKSFKVRIVGHGIDTEAFRPFESAPHDPMIMTIGRISRSKDYATLIRAVSHIPSAKLSIIGAPVTESDKAYMHDLEALVKRKNLESRVAYRGAIRHDDVPFALRDADLFVNLSKTGSLDKAVLEAMACGVPALTSNEAFETMLSPFGLMFKEGDDKGLADLIEKTISLDTRALGLRLREIVVRDHSLPRLIGRIRELYETSR